MTPKKKKKIKEEFLSIYRTTACNISISCKKVNISRNTFYNWYKEDKEFREKCIEEEESLKDFAETMLYQKIKEKSTPELLFYLKTKCKDRGYVEKTETDIRLKNISELIKFNVKSDET